MTCNHDLAERETACADGFCPLCLKAEIARLREALMAIERMERTMLTAIEPFRLADACVLARTALASSEGK